MSTIHLTCEPNGYGDGLRGQTFEAIVRQGNGSDRGFYSAGVVPAGAQGRKVSCGPIVPGPWGFIIRHPSIIASDGLSMREREGHPPIIDIDADRVTIDGLPGTWQLVTAPNGNLDLRQVDDVERAPVTAERGGGDAQQWFCTGCGGSTFVYRESHPSEREMLANDRNGLSFVGDFEWFEGDDTPGVVCGGCGRTIILPDDCSVDFS